MPLYPVREPCPDLPVPRKGRRRAANFGREELFGFDTETTWCGKKELRSAQFAFYTDGLLHVEVYALRDFFKESATDVESRLESLCREPVRLSLDTYDELPDLRRDVQSRYESLLYAGQPRFKRDKSGKMKGTGRKPRRCAVAFNGNFDLGVIADETELSPDMSAGGMEGAGCVYHFTSAYRTTKDAEYGLKIKALFLGAFNVPFTPKRGELWDISAATRTLWGAGSLAAVGREVGFDKLTGEGTDTLAYAAMDAVVTLHGAIRLTADLEAQGFTGNPDRFISGATVAKDLMERHYEPFYLTEPQHEFVWPAYFGGMTGALSPHVMREPLHDLIYGDLDGAYNASGQMLDVFSWAGVKWLEGAEVRRIVEEVRAHPSRFWDYGSLHIEVEGDFDLVPVRVGKAGEGSVPTSSEGLVWARVDGLRTTLTLGDFLHSKPRGKIVVIRGLMATRGNQSPCLFKMCADERAKFPKKDAAGAWVPENFVPNTWWKLAGNTIYGSFANRNGKDRTNSGKWFNGLIASSITGAIRHAMWTVNHASDAVYNDTDSALTTTTGFKAAQEALKPLGIGFSNKTSDELGDADIASVGVVQGSKRYALLGPQGQFGAKSHGLGSWFVFLDGRVQPVAHNEDVLRAVWSVNYPEVFGEPDPALIALPVFHRFSVRTRKVSDMVKAYALRRFGARLSNLHAYGKAGNFGFLTPSVVDGKITPTVAYTPEEAADLSGVTLLTVATLWGASYDKKFDYATGERHVFNGSDFVQVRAVDRTQDLEAGGVLGDSDISVHVSHGGGKQ